MAASQLLEGPRRVESFVVVDPCVTKRVVTPSRSKRGTEATRLESLSGATVALIDNGMGSSSLLVAALTARLCEDLKVAEVIHARKPSVSVAPLKPDWERIVEHADAGITVFGGCGSCSARTVRDAIELEWANIPAAPIVHEALTGSALAMKRMSKMPDYPLIEVKYPARPTAIWSDEETQTVVDYLLPQIVARLTTSE